MARPLSACAKACARCKLTSAEIQTMLGATFRQLNAEYGFSLQAPQEPAPGALHP
jgi:hypothetical protein